MKFLLASSLAALTLLAACGNELPPTPEQPALSCGEVRPRAETYGRQLWIACGASVPEDSWQATSCGIGYHAVAHLGEIPNAIYIRCAGGQLSGRSEIPK
jgi:hypothetical protein